MAASGSFAAMKSVPYRLQFIAYVLAMMADNIEPVSYTHLTLPTIYSV